MTRHLSQEEILRQLDGELSKRAARRTSQHLKACWTCEAEFDRLKDQIAAIVDAQASVFEASLPPPPAAWPRLEPRLEQAVQRRPVPLWKTWISWAGGASRWQLAYGGMAAAAIVLVVLLLVPATRLSAKDVLARAVAADTARLAVTDQKVVRQRVRVKRTVKRAAAAQTATLESFQSAKATYWNSAGDSVGSDLYERYQANGLAYALPLSPPAVQGWVKLAGAEPVSSREGDRIEVRIVADTSGQVHGLDSMSVIVEPQAWHVEQMTISFADASYQLTEEQSAIVDRRDVPADVLARLDATQAPPPRMAALPPRAAGASSPNLDDVEMAVCYDLHGIDADIGENIEVARRAPDRIVVSAWDASPKRQEELMALLGKRPGVQLEFQRPAAGVGSRTVVIPETAPASQTRDLHLDRFFTSPETQENYTRSVLHAGAAVLAHFYALRDLAQRWPAEKDAELSPGAKAQLRAMVHDHARDARADLSAWESELDLLMQGLEYKAAAGVSPVAPNWREDSISALAAARRTDATLRSLLTVSDAPLKAEAALPRLQQSLSELERATRHLLSSAP